MTRTLTVSVEAAQAVIGKYINELELIDITPAVMTMKLVERGLCIRTGVTLNDLSQPTNLSGSKFAVWNPGGDDPQQIFMWFDTHMNHWYVQRVYDSESKKHFTEFEKAWQHFCWVTSKAAMHSMRSFQDKIALTEAIAGIFKTEEDQVHSPEEQLSSESVPKPEAFGTFS